MIALLPLLLALQQAEAPAPAPERLFVVAFKAEDVDKKVVRLIERAVVESADQAGYDAVTSAEIGAILDVEAARQAAGCDGTSSCVSEIAGSLGAGRIISGTVTRVGGISVLALTLFDGKNGEVLERQTVEADKSSALRALAPQATRVLLGLASPDDGGAPGSSSLRLPLLGIGGTALAAGVIAVVVGGIPFAFAVKDRGDAEAATTPAAIGRSHDAYEADRAAWNSWGVVVAGSGTAVALTGALLLVAGATAE